MIAHMGLTFRKSEKEWAVNWMGKERVACNGIKEFGARIGELFNYRQLTGSDDLPPPGWKKKGPSKTGFKMSQLNS